jgi:hypothetical protein
LQSTRSFSRARTSERGWALAMALILAVLYFGLMELMMIDSSRALAEARRFRARIVATTLAENAAELAALYIAAPEMPKSMVSAYSDEQGSMTWEMSGSAAGFQLDGKGETSGLVVTRSSVKVGGRVEGARIIIDWTMHGK